MEILITFVFGGICGLVFYRLKVPGGMMIGALCGALLLTTAANYGEMPYPAKFAAQVTAGAFIGCTISRSDFIKLRQAYKSILATLASFLAFTLLTGLLMWRVSDLDLLTCLLCVIPGGISDVPLIAADMGADLSAVVVLQFIRVCVGLVVFPIWIAWVDRKNPDIVRDIDRRTVAARKKTSPLWAVAITLLLSALSALVGKWLAIPAGPLIFSTMGTLLVKIVLFPTLALPMPLRRIAQVFSGAYIGCSISRESLLRLHELLVPMICVVAAYLAFSVIAGKLLSRCFHLPLREAMLMVTPAGVSDMALIAADIGVQSSVLTVNHIFRLITSITIFPQVCYLFARLF